MEEAQVRISSLQFAEWMAVYAMEAEAAKEAMESGGSKPVDKQVAGWETFVAQHNAKLAAER